MHPSYSARIAEIAAEEPVPSPADDAELQQLLAWEIILPRDAMPDPASFIVIPELGVDDRVGDTEVVAPPSAFPAHARAAAAVGLHTRLRLRGSPPFYGRFRWRGLGAATELLLFHDRSFTSVALASVETLLELTDWISVLDLAERLRASVDDDRLNGIRSVVHAGLVEYSS